MKNEDRNFNTFQIFCEVSFRKSFDTFIVSVDSSHHSLTPPVLPYTLRYFSSLTVITVKWHSQILIKLRTLCCSTFSDSVEDCQRNTIGVRRRLSHRGSNRAYQ